jgi:hypothetical protein
VGAERGWVGRVICMSASPLVRVDVSLLSGRDFGSFPTIVQQCAGPRKVATRRTCAVLRRERRRSVIAALADVARDVPILQEDTHATCAWAGRLGAVACWQLCDQRDAVVARAATAPQGDLHIPRRIVEAHPYAYHQSEIGSGPHFNGYLLGDELVGVLNINRGQRTLFLVAQVSRCRHRGLLRLLGGRGAFAPAAST